MGRGSVGTKTRLRTSGSIPTTPTARAKVTSARVDKRKVNKFKNLYNLAAMQGKGYARTYARTQIVSAYKKSGRSLSKSQLDRILTKVDQVNDKRLKRVQKAVKAGNFKEARRLGKPFFVNGSRARMSTKAVRITYANSNPVMNALSTAKSRQDGRRSQGYKDFAAYKKANPTLKRHSGESRAEYLSRVKG